MKKLSSAILFLFLLISYEVKSQISQSFDMTFSDSSLCPNDSNRQIRFFKNWEAYQTTDSTWYGPKDTSCFSFRFLHPQGWQNAVVYFKDIDRTKPVYVKYSFSDSTAFPLDTNTIYSMSYYMQGFRPGSIELTNTCKENICSGLIMDIRIPDSAGTGYNYRNYTIPVLPNNFHQNEICFTTEKFINGNFLRNLIFKITPASTSLLSDSINLPNSFYIQTSGGFGPPIQIRDTLKATPSGNQHDYVPIFFGDNIVMHTAGGYPSANNQSFIDVTPYPNTATVDTLDINLNFSTRIHYQPFANLLPGYIAGSTTQRHVLNIFDQGAFMCLSFIDIILKDNSNFIYRSGQIKFNAPHSCLMFIDGAKLIVDNNSTLNYGTEGRGMLGLMRNSTIVLHKNASLNIYNTVMLAEGSGATEPQQFYMSLPPSTSLRFMPGSSISNQFSINQQMKLNVFMKGGTLDDSGLQEESKKLINRIYDIPVGNTEDDLTIFSNPVSDNLFFSYVNDNERDLTYTIYNVNGKLIQSNTKHFTKGINYFNADISEFASGIYFLRIGTEAGQKGKLFMKN